MFDCLFSPITINKTEIKNRVAYPSLGLLFSYDKKLNDRYFHFYVERARGGAGIVTVGPVGIDELGSGIAAPSLATDEAIPSFRELADAINREGAASWIQLFHAGGYAYSFMIGGKQALAPSAIYSRYTKETPKEMTIDDIKTVQEAFVRAGERAKEAGFTGVEIIGSAGYLVTQFLSPLKNQRTDEYGGSFENRTRFIREIIQRMRERLGPDYPVTIRMAGNDFVPGSNTSLDTPEFAKHYEECGIDAINVTGGWHESRVPQLSMELPRGGFAYLAQNIRNHVSVPVIASNRISDPLIAEQMLVDGMADMINLGRVLIADPYWPQKAMEGRVDEIRPCVSCSQGCTDELFSGRPVFCLANCQAGFEESRTIETAESPKKVMVVGAGPGGLEAAYRAAEAGHQVSLYDKEEDIGGQLWIAGTPPHKQEIWELIRFYDTMLDKYEVEVSLGIEVDIDFIKNEKPDHVILAEGAEPMLPPIKGMEGGKVISAWDVLREDPPLGRRIAIIGGGAVGLETAQFLATKGTISPETLAFLFTYNAESPERLRELLLKGNKEVVVFEMLEKAGKDVGRSTKWILLGNVEMHGVQTITGAKVTSVENGIVTYERDGKTETMEFDDIVNAVGSRSVRKIADAVATTGVPHSIIGDSVRPAKINDAIHEAFLAVQNL